MLVLGGLGQNWTYPNEVIGNDVQNEGWGLRYQNSGVPKIETFYLQMCKFFTPPYLSNINYMI